MDWHETGERSIAGGVNRSGGKPRTKYALLLSRLMRCLPILALLALAAGPATAQPGPTLAQVNAQIAALCDGDMACTASARTRLQDHCGRDRACVREALRYARERREDQDPSLSDLPAPLQDLVRDLIDLADQVSGTSSPSGLGDAAREQLNALPPGLQDRIRQRCGTDPECIRTAMEEAEARREDHHQTQEPEASEPSTPEAPEDETPEVSDDGDDESGPIPRFSLPLDTPPGRSLPDYQGSGSVTEGADGSRATREDLRDQAANLPGRELPGYAGSVQGGSEGGSSGSVATPNPPDGPLYHNAIGTTRISGNGDDRVRTLTAPDGAWLIAIRMAERSDDPCYVEAFYTTEGYVTGPDRDESIGDTYLTFDECGENGPTLASRNLVSMGIENNPPLIGGEPYAFNGDDELVGITTLQVCQRSSNDLVKGIAITGVTLDLGRTPVGTTPYTQEVYYAPSPTQLAQGQTEPYPVTQPVTHGFTRPNCNDWKAERSCSDGKVAVGLEIHYDKRNSGRSQITGLALKCAELDRP